MDLITDASVNTRQESHSLPVSAKNGYHMQTLKEFIASQLPKELTEKKIVGDLIAPLDFVVLVVPIDLSLIHIFFLQDPSILLHRFFHIPHVPDPA